MRSITGEIMAKILCTHCEKFFAGSPRHKNQMYCNKSECQKARRAAWQRKKLRTDPDYRLNQKQCHKNWVKAHPDYWKEYRRKNPKKAERNRMLQNLRNRRRSGKQELVAKMGGSSIAKMDPSNLLKNKALGQFWLVPVIAKMDPLKVNIHAISNTYE